MGALRQKAVQPTVILSQGALKAVTLTAFNTPCDNMTVDWTAFVSQVKIIENPIDESQELEIQQSGNQRLKLSTVLLYSGLGF